MSRRISKKKQQEILKARMAEFVEGHPDGWYDGDWIRFLAELEEAGVDVSDPDTVGLELERSRLLLALNSAGVRGLGPKRMAAIAGRYGTIWNFRRADVEDVASLPGLNRAIAEKAKTAVR